MEHAQQGQGGTFHLCHSTDEPEARCKVREADTKDHVLYNSMYMKMSRVGTSIETESALVFVAKAWGRGQTHRAGLLRGMRIFSG